MNAIILAGGCSTRMKRSGIEVHKPLLPINGIPNIERTILFLNDFGITDITIICGAFYPQYEYLSIKYNCYLETEERTSYSTLTAMKSVMNKLGDTFIIEGDVVLVDNIFVYRPYSFYYTIRYHNCEPDSWLPITNSEGIIKGFNIGKYKEPCILGVSYWCQKDTPILCSHLLRIMGTDKVNDKLYFWDNDIADILMDISMYTIEVPQNSATEMNNKSEYEFAQELCNVSSISPDRFFRRKNPIDEVQI